jgi:hypothetical protein
MSASVSVFLSNSQRYDFSSWKDFEAFDASQAERTKSLSVEMIFDVVRASEGSPERYKVQLSVQNTPAQFGLFLGPIAFSRIEDAGIPPVPIHASVEYMNYVVGKNLMSTIEGWEKALDHQDFGTIEFLQKHSSKIAQFLTFVSVLSGFLVCRAYLYNPNDPPFSSTSTIVYFMALTLFLFYSVGKFFSQNIERYIDRQKPLSNLTLTKGDQKFNAKIKSGNRSNWIRVAMFSVAILVQIACGIFVNYVWAFLLRAA